jgi:CHAD domain-containing protein
MPTQRNSAETGSALSMPRSHDVDLRIGLYLRKQIRELRKHMRLFAKSHDSECIHQTRVASRRLRTALELFEDDLPPRKIKRWGGEIRRLTRKLSQMRDKDVQVDFVRSVLTAPDLPQLHKPGLQRLLLRLEQERDTLRPRVLQVIAQPAIAAALTELYVAVDAATPVSSSRRRSAASESLRDRLNESLQKFLTELLSLEDSLDLPEEIKRHHRMRIAVKRLRYALEVSQFVFDADVRRELALAKEMQTRLGDVHDCDVWIEFLRQFEETERGRTREYFGHARPFARLYPGLEYFLAERQHCRQQLFAQTVVYWKHARRHGICEHLQAQLSAAPLDHDTPGHAQTENQEFPKEVR